MHGGAGPWLSAPSLPFCRSCSRCWRQIVDHDGINHLLRSYLLGYIISWGFTVGGLALLMVQYLSGGKWGLLVRRPLEAMSRCLPLVIVLLAAHRHLHEEAVLCGRSTAIPSRPSTSI